ncbi:unnamed protein product [Calicophoron daubneyi]|uniref:histone deacetylase n=1 Tax=Calicophoron daubneyi TaxID=300641 RepID=A0AAV2T0A9_CALDB
MRDDRRIIMNLGSSVAQNSVKMDDERMELSPMSVTEEDQSIVKTTISGSINESSLTKLHSFESALQTNRKSSFRNRNRQTHCSSFPEGSDVNTSSTGFTEISRNSQPSCTSLSPSQTSSTSIISSEKKNCSMQEVSSLTTNHITDHKHPCSGSKIGNPVASSSSTISPEVRERLKNCVLNKRRNQEHGSITYEHSVNVQNEKMDLDTDGIISSDGNNQHKSTIRTKTNQQKHVISGGSLDRVSLPRHSVVCPYNNFAPERHSSLTSHLTASNQEPPADALNSPLQISRNEHSIDGSVTYPTYSSLQAQCVGPLSTDQQSSHHGRHFNTHRPSGDHLRKTVSEPSLKVRGPTSHKHRSRAERRQAGATHSVTAVAAAMVASTGMGVSTPFSAEFYQQLTTALQHPNVMNKIASKAQEKIPPDGLVSMDTTVEDLVTEKNEPVQQPVSLENTGSVFPPATFTDLHSAPSSAAGILRTSSKRSADESSEVSAGNRLPDDSYCQQTGFDVKSLSSIFFQSAPSEYRASLPNLSQPSSLPPNRQASVSISEETPGNAPSQCASNMTRKVDYDGTSTVCPDERAQTLGTVTNLGSSLNFRQAVSILPRRYNSLGLISRTRSAPLGLAGGSSGVRYLQGVPPPLPDPSLRSSTVTSAANALAMEAASHFRSKGSSASLPSPQLAVGDQGRCTEEEQQRSKVVSQLRKKILERSEFLTTDRPEVNSADSATPMACGNKRNSLLERTTSSPVVSMASTARSENTTETIFTTVLAYDIGMLTHHCTCQAYGNHPENPQRLISIWQRLQATGLASLCHHQPGRPASLVELQSAHRDVYTVLFGSKPASRYRIDPSLLATVRLCRLACGGVGVDSDTPWHTGGYTAHAARLAAGCVIDLTWRVLLGQCPNGFALVRPPGHHAEPGQAMGFCYFNSVAVAARRAQFIGSSTLANCDALKSLSLRTDTPSQPCNPVGKPKVLIVDWDVHHGNGTQTIFYSDPSVLYISLHRHDDGGFFPGTGAPEEIGEGEGVGYTINIAWPVGVTMADAEYLAAFRTIVLPVAKEFKPDLVLVSAGFDAATGHSANMGGYNVSAACFGWMTYLLSDDAISHSRVVLALEGGYELKSLCECVEACVRALLLSASKQAGKKWMRESPPKLLPLSQSERNRVPHPSALRSLIYVAELHSKYWSCLTESPKFAEISVPASVWLPVATECPETNGLQSLSLESLDKNAVHKDHRRTLRTIIKQNQLDEEDDSTIFPPVDLSLQNEAPINLTVRHTTPLDEIPSATACLITNKTDLTKRLSITSGTPTAVAPIFAEQNDVITAVALARLAGLCVTAQQEKMED